MASDDVLVAAAEDIRRLRRQQVLIFAEDENRTLELLVCLKDLGLSDIESLTQFDQFRHYMQHVDPGLVFLPSSRFPVNDLVASCANWPHVAFIVYGDVLEPIALMAYLRGGATDYLDMPSCDKRHVEVAVLRAQAHGGACQPDATSPGLHTTQYAEHLRELAELPSLDEASRSLVAEALRRSGGDRAAAARLLGSSPNTIRKWSVRY